jgi:alkaline phosphatase
MVNYFIYKQISYITKEKMKMKRVLLIVLAAVLVISVVAVVFASPKTSEVKNVILLIGDGMGPTQVLAARYYSEGLDGRLTMETIPQEK